MQPLPVDAILPELVAALGAHKNVVLTAPPGSGKTTRVPPALMDLRPGEVLVLEPRRLAARLAASFMAEERGEKVGDTIGYQVRFEDVTGPRTRVKLVTEALLTRRMLTDPTLADVSTVVFDEFHERHVSADLALALTKRLQATARPDLSLVVMSATLDAGPVAAFLGNCYELTAEGRRFDVAIEHIPRPDARPLAAQVASAVTTLTRSNPSGDILVFLPGAAEIRAASEACAPVAGRLGRLVVPLYGDLPLEAQHRAVRRAAQPKVILATNVAETSITIDGVAAVVDSGLARVAGYDPWSGLADLRVRPVSRASAAQRAGRAGRTEPGRCLRLYTQHDHDTRPAFDKPEIERLDLAEVVLELAVMGISEPSTLDWLTPPPVAALSGASELLRRLGALDATGRVQELGRRMSRLPVHPRQARLVLEAQAHGATELGCTLAAILGERDIRADRGQAKESGPSDLLHLAEALAASELAGLAPDRLRASGLNLGPARAVVRARDQLLGIAGRERSPSRAKAEAIESVAGRAVLAGYPDRVARRKSREGQVELLLAGGGSARLSDRSVVRDAEWLVAVEAETRSERGTSVARVLLASAIEPDWLLDLPNNPVVEERELTFNDKAERIEATTRLRFGELTLDESHETDVDPAVAAPLLTERALAAGAERFADAEALAALCARTTFLRGAAPELDLPVIDDAIIVDTLADLCRGRRSFADVREAGLIAALLARLSGEQRRALDALAPSEVTLASGRRLRVLYEAGRPPHVGSFLQDFFGSTAGPTLVRGRVPVTLELLAPSHRPVQVTTDLAGFWRTHYPALKKELSRKYPRHEWPDDPAHAKPPPSGGRKRRP